MVVVLRQTVAPTQNSNTTESCCESKIVVVSDGDWQTLARIAVVDLKGGAEITYQVHRYVVVLNLVRSGEWALRH